MASQIKSVGIQLPNGQRCWSGPDCKKYLARIPSHEDNTRVCVVWSGGGFTIMEAYYARQIFAGYRFADRVNRLQAVLANPNARL